MWDVCKSVITGQGCTAHFLFLLFRSEKKNEFFLSCDRIPEDEQAQGGKFWVLLCPLCGCWGWKSTWTPRVVPLPGLGSAGLSGNPWGVNVLPVTLKNPKNLGRDLKAHPTCHGHLPLSQSAPTWPWNFILFLFYYFFFSFFFLIIISWKTMKQRLKKLIIFYSEANNFPGNSMQNFRVSSVQAWKKQIPCGGMRPFLPIC